MQTFVRQSSLEDASQRFMKIQEVFVFPVLFVWCSGESLSPVSSLCLF